MRMRSVMLLAIAAGCGLVAMFIFQQAMHRPAQAEVENVSVLVALTEISPGTKLDDTNTEFREFPIAVLPQHAIQTKEEYTERALKVRAMPGDILTLDKLSRKGQHGASNDIPAGMVAVTIPVDSAQSSAGLLQPGDRVDVMVTYRSLHQQGLGKEIKTVLEYVEVFATDKTREAAVVADGNAKTITLLVNPEQGKLLNLATEIGKLHLAMRSKEDSKARVPDRERFRPEEAEAAQALAQSESKDGAKDQPNKQDALTAFLATQQNTVTQAKKVTKTPEDREPVAPKWKVEIFAGDSKQVSEVDFEEQDLPADYVKQRDAWKARQAKKQKQGQPEGSSNPLVSGIKSLFSPGEAGEAAEETVEPNEPPQL